MATSGRWLGAALLGACAVAGVDAQRGQQPLPGGRPAGQFVAIGCLSREAKGPFILTDTRGEQPLVYRLDGDESALGVRVGHLVEAIGAVSPGLARGSGPHANAPVLKVTTFTVISKTCPSPKK